MHCEQQIWGICFVAASGGEAPVFKFADFIAAFALLVIVYTFTDVRYRFRLAIAPTFFHLFGETFVMIGVIGFGILLSDVWAAQHWLVPESLITAAIWRGTFAAMFLCLAMTWIWYAFIHPPLFNKKNFTRYYNELYYSVIKGSDDVLPIVATELSRSAESLIKYSCQDIPKWGQLPPQEQEPPEKTKNWVAEAAHDILLMIGNRKFCRHLVESSPATAIQFFIVMAEQKKAGLPLGQFAKNVSSEAILNKDSILYHEDEGFSAGLTGYLKSFSRSIYGNYELVSELGSRFGSPLDIRSQLNYKWDADQLQAYCRCVLLTFEDYLKIGRWGQNSPVLNRALESIGFGTSDLSQLDKSESYYSNDISKRLSAVVKFLQSAIELIDKAKPFPEAPTLKIKQKYVGETFYDGIADLMFETIFDASAVNSPFYTSWGIQYGSVWGEFFGLTERTRAWKIVQYKLRRLLYDEVREMDRMPNFKSARILGFCLNVMGLDLVTRSYGREFRPLQKAILSWTRRNYLRVRREYPRVANACLIGSITFDEENRRLVKTYAEGLSNRPDRRYLDLFDYPVSR